MHIRSHILLYMHWYPHTQRAFCVTALAICMCATFRKQKFMLGSKILWSQPSAKNRISKFSPWNTCVYFSHENFPVYGTHVHTLLIININFWWFSWRNNLSVELNWYNRINSTISLRIKCTLYSDINISYCEKYPKMVKCPYYIDLMFHQNFGSVLKLLNNLYRQTHHLELNKNDFVIEISVSEICLSSWTISRISISYYEDANCIH